MLTLVEKINAFIMVVQFFSPKFYGIYYFEFEASQYLSFFFIYGGKLIFIDLCTQEIVQFRSTSSKNINKKQCIQFVELRTVI